MNQVASYCGRTGEVYCKCLTKKDGISAMRVDIKATMRKLFTDHAVYVAFVIKSSVFDLPDLEIMKTRLLMNQQDIGDQLAMALDGLPGNLDFGQQVTALLQQHIMLSDQAIKASKAGEPQAIQTAVNALLANGDDISSYLGSVLKVDQAELKAMFRTHNNYEINLTNSLLQGQYDQWVQLYDSFYNRILEMSDFIVDGLY